MKPWVGLHTIMRITILGSGTGEPSLTRGSPGILLRVRRRLILIDSGSGTLRALLHEGVTYRDIDGIYYTHLHCDHVSELAPILFAMKNMSAPREKALYLVGPAGFKKYYHGLLRLNASTLNPIDYNLFIEEMWESVLERHGIVIRSNPVNHTPTSVAYRFESGGKSIVFSGDTGYCASIVGLARNADLLVLECSFPDEFGVEGHLTPSLAGRIAAEAGAKKLLLTHLYPACESFDIATQCKKVFSGEIVIACDGLKVKT